MKGIYFFSIAISLFACFTFSGKRQKNDNKTLIIIFNSRENYPGQISENIFWKTPENLDSILMLGERLNEKVDKQLMMLKDTSTFDDNFDDFFYKTAFIRHRNGVVDTFYTGPLFKYWKKGKKEFVDTSGFFENHFGAFSF